MQNRGMPFGKKLTLIIVIFIAITAVFYWVVADNWTVTGVQTGTVSAEAVTPEVSEKTVISQTLTLDADVFKTIKIKTQKVADQPAGIIEFRIMNDNQILQRIEIDAFALENDKLNEIPVVPSIYGIRGKHLRLEIRAEQPTGIAFFYGQKIDTGRVQFPVMTGEVLTINGQTVPGQLVASWQGETRLTANKWIFPVAGILLVCIIVLAVCYHRNKVKNKQSGLLICGDVYHRYSYLLKQLVIRDFKVKYKASVLGVLWSFLNPLLMMLVYYFVFSNIFKSNIEFFPVYLMAGIVIMNYFSDATNLGLHSVVGNSALITKVYMPKYIYPLSKVLSSAINLVISFIPMLAIMLIINLL